MTAQGTTAEQAYRALGAASGRMGYNNWHAQAAAHARAGRSLKTFRMTVTDAHQDVVDAMLDVMAGRIDPPTAYGLLWRADVLAERLPR